MEAGNLHNDRPRDTILNMKLIKIIANVKQRVEFNHHSKT